MKRLSLIFFIVLYFFDRFIRNLPRATEAKKLTKTLRPTLLTPKLEKLSENDRQLFIRFGAKITRKMPKI